MAQKENRKRLLTGDRPSGPLHLGHYVGSLENRIKFQDQYDCYFIIADHEYLTDHIDNTDDFAKNVESLVLDYLSVGIDPEKCKIFIESQVPQIAELNLIFSMMVKMSRVQRNPTVKDELQSRGIEGASFGFVGWPIIQAADILSMRGEIVPVGEDQIPHIEQTREIARTFNSKFKEIFKEPEAIMGKVARLPGLDGKKMSKSLNNAIFLSDDAQTVENKINKAITDPSRIHANDPGHPEVCNIFSYYQAFAPELVADVEKECKSGARSCSVCKKQMAEILNKFLDPIREKRKEAENNKDLIKEILNAGNKAAIAEAQITLDLVKEAMKIDYKKLLD